MSSHFKNTPEGSEHADERLKLDAFQEKLGYFFRDRGLLVSALCHASYANENGLPGSNERLEFLGDAVLGMVTAHVLYETYPEASEGELTSCRAKFVCRNALALWAGALGLDGVLKKGKSLKGAALNGDTFNGGAPKGATPPSMLANAVEAVLGAAYLDGGNDAVVRVVRRYLFGSGIGGGELDAKSRLQAHLQADDQEKNGLPIYRILSVTGPSHSPTFNVAVCVKGKTWHGKGPNRKAAELEAAATALEYLEKGDM